LVTQLARSRLVRESGRMRADIHDGPEQTLQSEAGYSNARPHQPGRRTSCTARADHTVGSDSKRCQFRFAGFVRPVTQARQVSVVQLLGQPSAYSSIKNVKLHPVLEASDSLTLAADRATSLTSLGTDGAGLRALPFTHSAKPREGRSR